LLPIVRAITAALTLTARAHGCSSQPARADVVISEIMADPRAVSDARGEWFELHNRGRAAISIRGWTIRSGGDAPLRIAAAVVIPAGGFIVLARNPSPASNGGVYPAWTYGGALTLANSTDWLAISDAGGVTVDSVGWQRTITGVSWELADESAPHASVGPPAWRGATARFGRGDRGTPGARYGAPDGAPDGVVGRAPNGVAAAAPRGAPDGAPRAVPGAAPRTAPGAASELVVRVLDVGQGDATYISNGTSKVIIDGGPDTARFGALLDSLGLNGSTIDVVVLTHEHYDHHAGLRELFRSSRRITVRYFFENQDPYSNAALQRLRDSVDARVARGETILRDTDDPCADGRAICTIAMNGGARLHFMRPDPHAASPNDRSAPVKLVGPDSASFTMWLAGDAEHEEIDWFARSGYDRTPGMKVNVLKGDHHGSCNGVSSWYLRATDPEWVTFSVGRDNGYGHVHTQAKTLYNAFGKRWYRTDENGTVVFRTPGTPGSGYTVSVVRGRPSMSGHSDRRSTQPDCNPMP
jgi:competence protein ComEC